MKKLSILIVVIIIVIFAWGSVFNKDQTICITKVIDLSKSEFTSIQISNLKSGETKLAQDKYLIDDFITKLSHYKIKKFKGNVEYRNWNYELQIGGSKDSINLSDNYYIQINSDVYEITEYKIDFDRYFNEIKE